MIQFVLNGLCSGGVYALVALGFGLIFFAGRTFHIAHGAVYTAGAYGCLVGIRLGVAVVPAVIAGVLGSALLGMLVERLVYRPLRDPRRFPAASSTAIMISSLGAYIVLVNLLAMGFGNESKVLRYGAAPTFAVAGGIVTSIQLAQLVAAVVAVVVLGMVLEMTRVGQTVRALADDPELINVLGYDPEKLRLGVFGVGSALGGLGGTLAALDLGVDPQVGFEAVLFAAVAVLLGGTGRFLAPAAGALLLGILQGLVAWQTSAKWASAVVFLLLIALLTVRRQGLFGLAKRAEEM